MSTTATEVTAEKSTKASKANVETVGTTEPLEEQRGRHILQLKESKSRKRSCSANSKQASRKKNKLDGTTDGTTHQHYNLVLIPFDASKFTTGLSKYDKCCKGKVLYTPEYAPDIFQRLFECEVRCCFLSHSARDGVQTALTILISSLLHSAVAQCSPVVHAPSERHQQHHAGRGRGLARGITHEVSLCS